jgi:uroporphyrinogen III methyltransferase/synthase
MKGRVLLVGAGPGDPGLLTLRGAEALASADLVLYDALANPKLLELAPADAERRLVGKRQGKVSVAQSETERALVDAALAGKTVVRLKGGDPFIFGRGGEEAEACARAGVPFEVVPGVTSAIAGPAYAGIPLTHRDHASSVTFVTARAGEEDEDFEPGWAALAAGGGTLVFLMGMLRAAEISRGLVGAGMSADTPAAVVQWATLPQQRTARTSLALLAKTIESEGLRPPGLIVVGSVAGIGEQIAWFEALPLFGRRIAVTRARHQAAALARLLERAGAEVVEYPTIEIQAAPDKAEVARAYNEVGTYDWLVLTSPNGAQRFLDGFLSAGHDIRELAGVSIAAIGPATAAVVEARGIHVAATPTEYRAEALVEALGDPSDQRFLRARAAVAREVLPDTLRDRGAHVDVVPIYETTLPDPPPDAKLLATVDAVTFTSSSTVTNFLSLGGDAALQCLKHAVVAAIGPITAGTLRDAGCEPQIVASEYTTAQLARELINYFAKGQGLP